MNPRFALRASIISGDRDREDADLNTFNPFFPKGNYFGESSTLGPMTCSTCTPWSRFGRPRRCPWKWAGVLLALQHGGRAVQPRAKTDPIVSRKRRGLRRERGFDPSGMDDRPPSQLLDELLALLRRPVPSRTGPGKDMEYFSFIATYRF